MISDARKTAPGAILDCDVCVVGAGAAGISLALGLEDQGGRILVLESGGMEFDGAIQSLLEGEVTGAAYPPLRDTRMAGLGGSTAVWAGWCRPLDALDFTERGGARAGSWPFGAEELDPFYREAHDLLGLAPFDYRPEAWGSRSGLGALSIPDGDFLPSVFHVSPVHFGERYRSILERSSSIQVLLRATALRLHQGPGGAAIRKATVGALGGGAFDVTARTFVLAAGGIENARLLLLSGDGGGRVPGNAGGCVGRYFTEHAFLYPGSFVSEVDSSEMRFFFPWRDEGMPPGASVRGGFALSRKFQEDEGLLNLAISFRPPYEAHAAFASEGVQAMLELWDKLRGRGVPGGTAVQIRRMLRSPRAVAIALWRRMSFQGGGNRWPLKLLLECEPRRENRVVLSNTRDAFGRPLPRVEWTVGKSEIRSASVALARFDEALRRGRFGRIQRNFPDHPEAWRAAVVPAKHHMGTTRMHDDPAEGVVDRNGRVHGVQNLYLAGSSVFPTVGYANPTLTVVALARRLAAHLRIGL